MRKLYYAVIVYVLMCCSVYDSLAQSSSTVGVSPVGISSKVGISVYSISDGGSVRPQYLSVLDAGPIIFGDTVVYGSRGRYGVLSSSNVFRCSSDQETVQAWLSLRRVTSFSSNGADCGVPAVGLTVYSSTLNSVMRLSPIDSSIISPSSVLAVGDTLKGSDGFSRSYKAAYEDNAISNEVPRDGNMGFDGSTWDRIISVSSTNNTATTTQGVRYYTPISTWSVTNTPGTGTSASASRAAGGGTVRHVATSVTVCVAANATAQTPLLIHLRDGATGAGTIIRTWAIAAPVTSSQCIDISGLNMTGSANTAMTLETAAAPVSGAQATVTLTGYSTP